MPKLKELRQQIDATQEDVILSGEGKLKGTTYRNAEKGNKVRYSTAATILQAFNQLLANKNILELKLEDLDLSLE